MGPRNANKETWNVIRGPCNENGVCNVIMGPCNVIMGPCYVIMGHRNVNTGRWNWNWGLAM